MRKLIHEKDRNVYAEQCVFHGYFCFSLIIMQMKISKKYFVNSSVRKIVLKTHSTFSQTIANWVYFSPTKNKSEYGSGVAIVTGVKYVSTLHNSFSKHSSYGIWLTYLRMMIYSREKVRASKQESSNDKAQIVLPNRIKLQTYFLYRFAFSSIIWRWINFPTKPCIHTYATDMDKSIFTYKKSMNKSSNLWMKQQHINCQLDQNPQDQHSTWEFFRKTWNTY